MISRSDSCLGKGEVGGSIPLGSTSFPRLLAPHQIEHCAYARTIAHSDMAQIWHSLFFGRSAPILYGRKR
jgi:hypothetical protein